VTLTVPRGVEDAEALHFARDKAAWLRRQLAARPDVVTVEAGVEIPLGGQKTRIACVPGRGVRHDGRALLVPGPEETLPARLRAWLRETARDRLAAASDRYSTQLGRRYSRLSLRDPRSRWGSCSDAGGLMYSWRLVMAPPDVLDYVAAHEVAHLAEMNHSPAFWANVERLKPGFEEPRQWLRRHGAGLHRYRFGK